MQARQLRIPLLKPLQDVSNNNTIHTPLTTTNTTRHSKCGCSISSPEAFSGGGRESAQVLTGWTTVEMRVSTAGSVAAATATSSMPRANASISSGLK